jgi:hypothetical protein
LADHYGALADFDVRVQGGVFGELLARWGIGRLFIEGDPEATRILREKMLDDAMTAVLHLVPDEELLAAHIPAGPAH